MEAGLPDESLVSGNDDRLGAILVVELAREADAPGRGLASTTV